MKSMNNIRKIHFEMDELLCRVPIDFGGGCSISKATVLAYIIKSQKIARSIDIGIYRGRSFFPQAYAHSKHTGGMVIGIDPYLGSEAVEHDHAELSSEIDNFVKHTDFEKLFVTVSTQCKQFGLKSNAKIIRKTSNDAAVSILKSGEVFGLIHIDGNHDTKAVNDDINNYLPLLDKKNGFIVLDDISWSSIKPATDRLMQDFTLIYSRVDTQNDYAIFWNGESKIKKSRLRHCIAIAAEG